MWKVIVDYMNYHRIDDEDGNTIAWLRPSYVVELELENGDSGDTNLEALKIIVKKHNEEVENLIEQMDGG